MQVQWYIALFFLLSLILNQGLGAQTVRGELIPDCRILDQDSVFQTDFNRNPWPMPDLVWTNDSIVRPCLDGAARQIMQITQGELTGKAIYRIRVDTSGKVDFVCYHREVHPMVTREVIDCLRSMEFPPIGPPGKRQSYWLAFPFKFGYLD